MYKKDVLNYFGSGKAVQEAMNYSSSGTVSRWKAIIPRKCAIELAMITDNQLKFDDSLYQKSSSDGSHV
ncbi:MAG: Cro/CI family transcriptional regulator [Pseudomonadota bacterium]|nr:Cro/CI family transcriptional regulator [Pseudomonadota bacterium]